MCNHTTAAFLATPKARHLHTQHYRQEMVQTVCGDLFVIACTMCHTPAQNRLQSCCNLCPAHKKHTPAGSASPQTAQTLPQCAQLVTVCRYTTTPNAGIVAVSKQLQHPKADSCVASCSHTELLARSAEMPAAACLTENHKAARHHLLQKEAPTRASNHNPTDSVPLGNLLSRNQIPASAAAHPASD